MKKMILLGAASTLMLMGQAAFAKVALEDWDYESLYDDWKVTKVMDGVVYSSDGEKVGEVHDIILNDAGLIDSVVVEQKEKQEYQYFEVSWVETNFIPSTGAVTINKSTDQVEDIVKYDIPEFSGSDEMEVSNLVGMNVNTDGDAPYGEINNMLFTPVTNDLSAFVIESDGVGALTYAIPADWDFIDYDADIVDLPYASEDLDLMDEF